MNNNKKDNNNPGEQHNADKPAVPKDMRETLKAKGPDFLKSMVESATSFTSQALPDIELHGNGRPLSAFAAQLGKVLGKVGVYQRGDAAFRVSKSTGKLTMLDPQQFRTFVEKSATIVKRSDTSDGPKSLPLSMDIETARGVCASLQFLEELPPLRSLLPVRMPVMRGSGVIGLLESGYDEESQILTLDGGCEYPMDMNTDEAFVVIDELLEEFPFADGRSKSVAVAAMLTVFTSCLLPEDALFPCFIYQANAEGSGKTTLASLAGIAYGIVPAQPAPTTATEWSKRLLSLAMSGSRVILFDNLRGHLNTPALEAYITATTYSDRILGVSTEFKGKADAVILITGNRLTITPDLRRRSLFVELFMTELRSEDRTFKRRLDPAGIRKEQPRILAALWALVKHWDSAGRPTCSKINASFASWSEVVGGIVEHAGYGCPTEHAELIEGGDTRTRDIESLAQELEPDTPYRFAELLDICIKKELFQHITDDSNALDEPSKKAKSRLANVFKEYDKRHIAPDKILTATGKGHARRYEVKGSL